MAKEKVEAIELPKPDFRHLKVRVVGDRVVTHRFSEKAKKQMRDKTTKKATKGREPKDPQGEYVASLYWLDKSGNEISANGDPAKHRTGFGIKSLAFKKAMVRAGKESLGMNMTFTRTAFHISGEFVRIMTGDFKKPAIPKMREDVCPLPKGGADLRYRGEFLDWGAELNIRYNAAVISAEQIINLLIYAGFGVGVCEHRPEKNGNWGMFQVA